MASDPPPPAGLKLWTKPVSPEMTRWATTILHDPLGHPLFSVDTKMFGDTPVAARVENHVWTFRAGVKVFGHFRGVTLYENEGNIQPSGVKRFVEGVDVSKWQGVIDWPAVKAAGYEFAYVRFSDGLNLDPHFYTNHDGATAAGLKIGAYQFFRPNEDPERQAKLLLDHLVPGLSPALDCETLDGLHPGEVFEKIQAWCMAVPDCAMYTSPAFWKQMPHWDAPPKLWVAQWSVSEPIPPSAWKEWDTWQYTDKGVVPGINGHVDLNKRHAL